jgi:hypothetical protein
MARADTDPDVKAAKTCLTGGDDADELGRDVTATANARGLEEAMPSDRPEAPCKRMVRSGEFAGASGDPGNTGFTRRRCPY